MCNISLHPLLEQKKSISLPLPALVDLSESIVVNVNNVSIRLMVFVNHLARTSSICSRLKHLRRYSCTDFDLSFCKSKHQKHTRMYNWLSLSLFGAFKLAVLCIRDSGTFLLNLLRN
jgi:hypothetical protein